MSAEEPRKSPPENAGSPFAADAETVAAAAPQSPRLGIIHLFGWTTCIAAHAAAERLIYPGLGEEISESLWSLIGLYALGQGAALGGLMILVSRRLRGLRFPVYPGEVLLVLLGFGTVYWLAARSMFTMIDWLEYEDAAWTLIASQADHWIYYALFASLYLLAGRRIKLPRWRKYFYFASTMHALTILASCAGITFWSTPVQLLDHLATSVLTVVIVIDWRRRLGYPWTHWLGAAIVIWFTIVGVGQIIAYTFFERVFW